jgi:hypothetical protein
LVVPAIVIRLPITTFFVVVLAVWRLTHLLWGEDGPWGIFVRIRRLAGTSLFGRLLDCFYCLSLWVAAPLAVVLADTWTERGLIWFSLSGGAILLERATSRKTTPPPAIWHEQPLADKPVKEDSINVLLR